MNREDTNGYATLDEEKPRRLQPYTKNYRHLRKARTRRGSFPGVKWSALETYIQVVYGLNSLYLGIYMHIHICMQ